MKRQQKGDSHAAKPAVGRLNREEITAIATEVARAEIAKRIPAASPSPETLALIAANLANDGNVNPAEAVARAAALYDAACARLQAIAKTQASYEREADAWADITQPEKFPALFDDFLRLIVCAKTTADSTKRFRDFLRDRWKRFCVFGKIEEYPKWAEWTEQKLLAEMKPKERQHPKWAGMTEQQIGEALLQENIEKKVADDIAEWKRLGFRDQRSWFSWAKDYSVWWASQRSDKARAAAKKSKKPF